LADGLPAKTPKLGSRYAPTSNRRGFLTLSSPTKD
jgi:hypothetical protein